MYEKAADKCLKENVPSAAVGTLIGIIFGQYTCEPFLEQGSCPDGEWRVLEKSPKFYMDQPACIKKPCIGDKIPFKNPNGDCIEIGNPTMLCENDEIIRPTNWGFGNFPK